MTKPFLQRLKDRLLLPSGHKKQQGVAILTVLAIITLMTVLVVSFFTMARSAQATAKGSVEIQRVTTLKDTIINLVIAQFREASKLSAADARDFKDIVTWTSQPGAIRTYSGTDPGKNKLFKLYSSDVPQLINLRPGETSSMLQEINKDAVADWAQRPDEFTDMNRPVYTAASGDKAIASGSTDAAGYSYPIADPRMYNGKEDPEQNVEGFVFTSQSLNKRMAGVDAQKGQLAMPVRWIYQLQDGTLGYLNNSQAFTALNGEQSGEPSRSNPIVGRLAWWADDESCKVNVNTASIPAVWDTPRTTSKEDVWLAKTQPLAGEYQRYPGHPSTVDLSAIFFPGARYVATDGSWKMPIGIHMKRPLAPEDANRIWDLAPFIVGNTSNAEDGTSGGTILTPNKSTVGYEEDDHLFSSLDEVYFKASGTTNASLNRGRDSLLSEKKDPNGRFLKRLERSQFFITHKSHSPELTQQGFPRVSMFPMDTRAVPFITSTSTSTTLPAGVSPYDVTMGLNSTIGRQAYFFQRDDPTSRHAEFYSNSNGRNLRIFGYLKELSRLPVPGYPEGFPGATAFKIQGLSEDPDGRSLTSKYPPGINPITKNRYLDSGKNVTNGSTLLDASDRSQILLNMLDWTRSINMQPAFVQNAADKYDDGNGQATGLCGCGGTGDHPAAVLSTQTTWRSPKGAGKLLNPSEVAIVINVAGMKTGTDAGTGDWNRLSGAVGPKSRELVADNTAPGTRYIVEVGFCVGSFNPKLGWSPVNPQGGIAVASTVPGGQSPLSDVTPTALTAQLPIVCNLDGKRTEILTVGSSLTPFGASSSSDRVRPLNLLGYGGMQGPRALMPKSGGNWAMCAPICILSPGNSPTSVRPAFGVDPGKPLRIMTMDGAVGGGNVISAVDLMLPTDFLNGIQAGMTGKSLTTMYTDFNTGARTFPDPAFAVRSLVIPHGDYRFSTMLRMDSDLFVAHGGYFGSRLSHSLFEANVSTTKRRMTGGGYSAMTLIDPLAKPVIPQLNSAAIPPMLPLPAVDMADLTLKNSTLYDGTKQPGTMVQKQPDPDSTTYASLDPARQAIFGFGRRDGNDKLAKRGSSDPNETGDFDNGWAAAEDGPYMNYPDEGDRRKTSSTPYFVGIEKPMLNNDIRAGQTISPNFLVRSPVDFGSIPTGLQARVPWQTLRFRPDPGMNDSSKTMKSTGDNPPPGLPFANFCGPRDHFFLDMFWMPVVEPYSISEPFSTKGTINLNQQIFPFLYINRTTALHALLRGERMLAIPNDAAAKYKKVNPTTGAPDNNDDTYRYFINAQETVKQFLSRYTEGKDAEGFPLAFNTFRSASEICEVWLVPDKNGDDYDTPGDWDLQHIVGTVSRSGTTGFWSEHRLTGDNSRERPYANLYPRVTVRSNVFKLHLVAQTLQKARSESPETFNGAKDIVTAEWRGSCMIERSIDPRDPLLNRVDYTQLNATKYNPTTTPKLDKFYTYRVTEVKQLTQ